MSIANVIPLVSRKIDNAGVLSTTDERMASSSLTDTFALSNFYRQKADAYAKMLQDFIKVNKYAIPELRDQCSYSLLDSATSNCSIFLGGEAGYHTPEPKSKYTKDEYYTVNEQDVKNVSITTNGDTIITPDAGYTSIKQVNVNTDIYVPKVEESRSIELDIYPSDKGWTFEPSEGYEATKRFDIETNFRYGELTYNLTDNGDYRLGDLHTMDSFISKDSIISVAVQKGELIDWVQDVSTGTLVANVTDLAKERFGFTTNEVTLLPLTHYTLTEDWSQRMKDYKASDTQLGLKVYGKSNSSGSVWSTGSVAVPSASPSVTITKNGSTTLSPSKYGAFMLKDVTINTNVPTTESKIAPSRTEEHTIDKTTTSIVFDVPSGYDGQSTVTLIPDVLFNNDASSWEITSNGAHRLGDYLPSSPLFISPETTINVNVPASDDTQYFVDGMNFYGSNDDDIAQVLSNYNFSKLTNANNLFRKTGTYVDISELNAADTESITTCVDIYRDGTANTISSLHGPSVTNAETCFYNAANATSIGDVYLPLCNNYNQIFRKMPSLTKMGDLTFGVPASPYAANNGLFYDTPSVTEIGNITNINACESLTAYDSNTRGTFNSYTSLTKVGDIIDPSEISAQNMFLNCTALTTVGNVTSTYAANVSSMFRNCSALETIGDVVLDTSYASSMIAQYMFAGTAIQQRSITLNKPTDCNYMFRQCTSLNYAPSMDYTKVTNAIGMFYGCTRFGAIYGIDLANATNITNLYYGCSNAYTPFSNTVIKAPNATLAGSLFRNCTNLQRYDVDLDLPAATNVTYMFRDCTSLTTVGNINIPVAVNTNSMFINCTSLTAVGTITAPASNAHTQMFGNCNNLTTIGGLVFSQGTVDLSTCPLTRESFLNIANSLLESTSPTTSGLSLSDTTKSLITDEDIAIVTAKGWSVG